MPNNRYDFAGRDDRLADEIVTTLENIQRTSRGGYDELVGQLNSARYSAVPAKIRKMNYPQLVSMRTLIQGYQARVQADNRGPIDASWRPELVGAGWRVRVPQIMSLMRPDGQVQRIIAGLNGGNLIANTFYPGNVSGIPDDTETLIATPAGAETGGGTDVRCHFVKQNDTTLLFWDADLSNDPDIYSTTLDANGDFTAPAVVATLASSGAGYTDRVIGEAFCDGRFLWVPEYDDGNTNLVIHKVNLVDGIITTQEIDNIDLGSATSNLVLFAIGDFCLVIGEAVTGPVTRYVAFELADGATPAAIDLDVTGIEVETAVPTRLLGGFGGLVHTDVGPRYRGFFTANAAGANGEAIHVIDFDPTAVRDGGALADVQGTAVQILGQSFPWSAIGFNGLHGVSADGARLLMASTRSLALTDETLTFGKLIAFSMNHPRQLSSMRSVDGEITALAAVSGINVPSSNMALLASIATGDHIVELNA